MDNKIYQEEIPVFQTTFNLEDFKQEMENLNAEKAIGFIYATENESYFSQIKNLITIYAEFESPQDLNYIIIINGKSQKHVKNICSKLKRKISNKQQNLSILSLIG